MAMLRIVLVQPGATDFDEQWRIKGSLDIPLNRNGSSQVDRTVLELASVELDAIYVSPSESALQTAAALANAWFAADGRRRLVAPAWAAAGSETI